MEVILDTQYLYSNNITNNMLVAMYNHLMSFPGISSYSDIEMLRNLFSGNKVNRNRNIGVIEGAYLYTLEDGEKPIKINVDPSTQQVMVNIKYNDSERFALISRDGELLPFNKSITLQANRRLSIATRDASVITWALARKDDPCKTIYLTTSNILSFIVPNSKCEIVLTLPTFVKSCIHPFTRNQLSRPDIILETDIPYSQFKLPDINYFDSRLDLRTAPKLEVYRDMENINEFNRPTILKTYSKEFLLISTMNTDGKSLKCDNVSGDILRFKMPSFGCSIIQTGETNKEHIINILDTSHKNVPTENIDKNILQYRVSYHTIGNVELYIDDKLAKGNGSIYVFPDRNITMKAVGVNKWVQHIDANIDEFVIPPIYTTTSKNQTINIIRDGNTCHIYKDQ